MKAIAVDNLSFSYSNQPVLENISFSVNKGEFLSIVGPNGTGKSTLMNLLSGLIKPDSGSVNITGQPITSYNERALASKVAVVRQEYVPVFGFSVIETVMMARTMYYGRAGFATAEDNSIVEQALEMTEVSMFSGRTLAELSGGERQRVFIARALAQGTAILLLDEPTSYLDLRHQVKIYDLLKRLQYDSGKTIVCITHDINLAAQYSDNVLLLGRASRCMVGGTSEVFSAERITEIFGVKSFVGTVGMEKFFLPLGRFAKDIDVIEG